MHPARRTVVAGLASVMLAGCSRESDPAPPSPTHTSDPTGAAAARAGTVDVVGSMPTPRRDAYLSHVSTAMREVAALWHTDWRTVGVRLVVASSGTEFARLTKRPDDGTVPAVTTPSGDVVVHPALWTSTSADGRQVIITHELTHVALGQGRLTGVPLWVIEGSAEVTAYRSAGLTPHQVAPSLFRLVTAGRGPSGPPSDDEIRDVSASPTLAYQKAWAWCAFLVRQQGEATFTDFVRRADARDPDAFAAAYDMPLSALVPAYRIWLRAQR